MRLVLFLLILTVVSALVAAAGDRMGHRAARRKLRLGKMRPRDVSTLIAITTGVLISLATFGVGMALSRDFRDALLRYDEIKRNTVKLEASVQEKEEQLEKAEASLRQQQVQLNTLESDLSAKTQQSEKLGSELEASQGELEQTLGQLSSKEAMLARQDKKIRSNEATIKDQLRRAEWFNLYTQAQIEEKDRQQRELQEAAQRRLIIAKDEPLFYGRIAASSAGNVNQIVQSAVSDVQRNLLDEFELQISPGSEQAAEAFISGYPMAGQDAMFVIFAEVNVFEGDDVRLAFTGEPLTTLLRKGDVVLDVTLSPGSAALSVFGGPVQNFDLPQQFDPDSFADFAVRLQRELLSAALDRGFLPELWSGDFPNPIFKLVDIAETLFTKPRPYKIQFVAKRDLSALDGLEDCEIHITSLPDAASAPETPGSVEQETEPAGEAGAAES